GVSGDRGGCGCPRDAAENRARPLLEVSEIAQGGTEHERLDDQAVAEEVRTALVVVDVPLEQQIAHTAEQRPLRPRRSASPVPKPAPQDGYDDGRVEHEAPQW